MKNQLLTIIFCLFVSGSWAQNNSKVTRPDLPTLQTFIDSAVARAPMREYHLERKLEAQTRIKTQRQQWTEFIGVETYYRYGKLGVIDQSMGQASGGTVPSLPITNNIHQSQNWWYVGAFLRVPLFAIVNSKVEVNRLKHTVKQSEYEMEDVAQAVEFRVIDLYNTLLLNLEILQMKAVLLETNNAQIKEAELSYANRKIDLGRLSQLQEMQSKVAVEFATARSDSRVAMEKLQTLSGIQLIGRYNLLIYESK